MADGRDDDIVAGYEVADQIGRHGDEFAMAVPYGTAPIRKFGQALSGRDESNRHPPGGGGVEVADIGPDRVEIDLGFDRPDYSPHFGGGSSSDAPHDNSQRFIAS